MEAQAGIMSSNNKISDVKNTWFVHLDLYAWICIIFPV